MNNDAINDWKIPLYKIYTDDEDFNLVIQILKRGTQWALGPEIEEFENQISKYVGTDYCLTFNSGTSALHATQIAYGIKQNDEVIIPSFSFIATANSVLLSGATPIFSDIEAETYGLDPQLVESKISKKTKAIIPMDYGGNSCKIDELKQKAQDNNLILIEDSAESLGASYQDKKVGSYADSAIFSFCGNKVLSTGEGGAVVTNDKSIYDKLKLIRSHGRFDSKNYFNNPQESEYPEIGYNWRMSSITASLGITQLAKLDKIIKMRQDNAMFISEKLSKCSQIITPQTNPQTNHIFQMYTISLPSKFIRDQLHEHLIQKRIFSKVYFQPIHLTSYYKNKFAPMKLEMTEKISNQVLTLPMYPNMTLDEKSYLINSILEFFE